MDLALYNFNNYHTQVAIIRLRRQITATEKIQQQGLNLIKNIQQKLTTRDILHKHTNMDHVYSSTEINVLHEKKHEISEHSQ